MRIIAGRLRGRALGPVPEGVRPTADRVRESLFSVLGSVEGLRVLDLCAGTGALGIEAYSRGASEVVWVERSRTVARALSARLADLGIETGIVCNYL
jgi:16S rRNA (guanine966-N2)-methyltransferase